MLARILSKIGYFSNRVLILAAGSVSGCKTGGKRYEFTHTHTQPHMNTRHRSTIKRAFLSTVMLFYYTAHVRACWLAIAGNRLDDNPQMP